MTAERSVGELFGARVRDLRLKRGLTQVDLAERLNLPQSRISEIESGARSPTLVTILRLSVALGCMPTDLVMIFNGEDVASLLQK